MVFIIFHQLELINVYNTGPALLVETVNKAILYHLILLNAYIPVDKCTVGQMVLVITLLLLYWIAMMAVVFVTMYFKIAIGSLLAINYYYSAVDILLSQDYFISNGLDTTFSIMSRFAKLTPQFIRQWCLVRNLSGIDQQFIHYLHAAVVSFILLIITVLAKRSVRISSFVSRVSIHYVCLLLLISYTSLTTTSL